MTGVERFPERAGPIVFFVSHSSAGGAQEIWANLAEAFRQQGHAVSLLALYPLRETVRETSAALPWRYVVPRRPQGPIGIARMLAALVKLIRTERPGTIFTAMPAANVLAALAARVAGAGTRVVISHHSPAQTHNPLIDRVDGYTGALASVRAVVSVSDSVAASLDAKPARYLAKRRTIHNALPPAIETLVRDLHQRRLARPPQGRVVVATGRLAAQKNYPLLIRAARHLPDVRFQIVGNGPDEATLRALAADLGATDRIEFLGHRPREEALAILAEGDVFAQVSLFEGHSLALIEAAKIGLPLIVSDVPVQIEGVTATDGERCALIVGIEDDVALASAIARLLDDPVARAHWAERALHLSQDATFDAMVAHYAELAA